MASVGAEIKEIQPWQSSEGASIISTNATFSRPLDADQTTFLILFHQYVAWLIK